MKIDRPIVKNVSESTTAETTNEAVQPEKSPSPKTDSVEIKTNSFYNFENQPKLDPSQSLNTNAVPSTMIPGVPFREKVELPKTLPNGTSVDGGVASGDLGFGKTRPGPNHMGVDMKGNDIRNQLNDALNLKEGAGVQSSTPPSDGTVNLTGLAGKTGSSLGDSSIAAAGKKQNTYDPGFSRPGMGLYSADKEGKSVGQKVNDAIDMVKKEAPKVVEKAFEFVRDVVIEKGKGVLGQLPIGEALTILDMPAKTQEITGDANDHVRGIAGAVYPENRLEKMDDQVQEKYVNPDAEGTPVVTEETLEKVSLRRDSTTQPGVQDDAGPIDASKLSETDPRRNLISNPNPEDQSSVSPGGNVNVVLDAKGPDTVNPNDPDLGGGNEPIVIDPNRPRP